MGLSHNRTLERARLCAHPVEVITHCWHIRQFFNLHDFPSLLGSIFTLVENIFQQKCFFRFSFLINSVIRVVLGAEVAPTNRRIEMTNITARSLEVFLALAAEANDWNGQPLFDGSKEDRGNLTQLKQAGLLTTFSEEGNLWVDFTDAGIALAAENGITI